MDTLLAIEPLIKWLSGLVIILAAPGLTICFSYRKEKRKMMYDKRKDRLKKYNSGNRVWEISHDGYLDTHLRIANVSEMEMREVKVYTPFLPKLGFSSSEVAAIPAVPPGKDFLAVLPQGFDNLPHLIIQGTCGKNDESSFEQEVPIDPEISMKEHRNLV